MTTNLTPSLLVESQVPRYIRENNPRFVQFLQHYYEFVEQSKIQGIIQDVQQYIDPDRVDEEFLHTFFEEFKIMPRVMAADKRLVAKFVYDIYKSKGTEVATKLLFKMMFGEDITINHPADNILRASVGTWVKDTVLTIEVDKDAITAIPDSIIATSKFGDFEFEVEFFEVMPGTLTKDRFRLVTHLTASFVLSTNTIALYANGVLLGNADITISPESVQIIAGGAGWKVGNLIEFPDAVKSTIAQVKAVDDAGAITSIAIIQYGFHDSSAPVDASPYVKEIDGDMVKPVYITNGAWTASIATLQLTFGTQVSTSGYFKTLDGMLSVPSICLEDNFFYQIFSYVINTDHAIGEFKEPLKLIHPAGVKYFAEMTKRTGLSASYSVNRILD